MLNKQVIYHKTPKGTEAIANRQSGLAPKLRSLLIMVDGKRGYAALAALTGECEPLLLQLAQDGLIEPVGGVVPASATPGPSARLATVAAPAPAPAAAAAAAAPVVVSLPEAKRVAVRLLTDLLGPSAEVLCMKIESTGNLADFVNAVKRARAIVSDLKGGSVAENFIAQVEPHTPQS